VPVPTPEEAALRPVSAYGRSKLLAEDAVRAFQARDLDATIIRPALIYGPGDRTFTPLALRLARLPILPLINGGQSLLDLVYVRDVANLIRLAAFHPQAAGRIYNAGPGRPTSLADLVRAYRQATGRGPHILSMSPELAARTSWLSRRLVGPFVPGTRAALSPQGVALLSRDIHLSMKRAADEIGFQPRYDLQAGLQEMLAGATL
jgi:nucleoside-diphosphate-sugar epimerase